MKEQFVTINFTRKTLALLETINGLLRQYQQQGYVLTVRQLYYQLVARNHIPNTVQSYKRLAKTVSDGRLCGIIDWDMIVDRNRQVIFPSHWRDPAQIVSQAAAQFRVDRWATQGCHVEVMIEKDAVAGVLEQLCKDLDVRLIPNRGYASQSMMWAHGYRLYRAGANKTVYLFYLGDHDPSGLDMDRDICERLAMFSYHTRIHFQRLALTREQIDELHLPPNPAKLSDSRAAGYIGEHGRNSWELDALEPAYLNALVEEAVLNLRDPEAYGETMLEESGMRDDLETFASDWLRSGETT